VRDLFLVTADGKTPIQLEGAALKSGGQGEIFRVAGFPGRVAKIYHGKTGVHEVPREKIEAMIAKPPSTTAIKLGVETLPVFSWPSNVIEDAAGEMRGFLMSEVPTERAVTLTKFMSRLSSERDLSEDDRSLPRRFQICRNLSAAIAELHRQRHFFVDLKPDNIFLFKDASIVCLIDNDGFSIDAPGIRYPAQTYTQEYLAPELLKAALPPASVVNDWQDRFALATIIFQILNNGLHPFQGIPGINTEEWHNDFCVLNGYYPYGSAPCPASAPSPASIHDLWSTETKALFERAFTSTQASKRPSAQEWCDHLNQYVSPHNKFKSCARFPNQVTHIHLADGECHECRFLQGTGGVSPVKPATDSGSPVQTSGSGLVGAGLPPPQKGNLLWLIPCLLGFLGAIVFAAYHSS